MRTLLLALTIGCSSQAAAAESDAADAACPASEASTPPDPCHADTKVDAQCSSTQPLGFVCTDTDALTMIGAIPEAVVRRRIAGKTCFNLKPETLATLWCCPR